MLEVVIPAAEYYDETRNLFIDTKEQKLYLEHSLVSLAKWESKYEKPFLSREEKTSEEILDYIKFMTITQNVDPNVYLNIPVNIRNQISEYINAPMTATKFTDTPGGASKEIVTAELIYYWMTAANIPFECQKWHLNRLLTLIKVCSIKNAPPDKKRRMGRQEILNRNHMINEQRKQMYKSRG